MDRQRRKREYQATLIDRRRRGEKCGARAIRARARFKDRVFHRKTRGRANRLALYLRGFFFFFFIYARELAFRFDRQEEEVRRRVVHRNKNENRGNRRPK